MSVSRRHRRAQHQARQHSHQAEQGYHTGSSDLPDMRTHDDLPHPARQVMGDVDRTLLGVTFALVAFGLVSVYTASAHQALAETGNLFSITLKQALAAGLGLGLMWLISWINYHRWFQLAKPIAFVAIGLLLATMLAGVTANGSERWLPLPFGFQFQPSEFAKLAAIVLVAQAVSKRRLLSLTMMVNLAMVGGMILLIYQQPNLSVSMIVGILTLLMLFIGGTHLAYYILVLPPGLFVLFHKIRHTEYQWRRITGWLNPWADPQDSGYNLIQSYYAIGSGSVFGAGLGRSVQKLYYLPFQHTDFIFSVICEEMGLVGAVILIGLFATFVWRGFSVALQCGSCFGRMLALGLTIAIGLQVIINIAVTTGMMPVTGVTLPLISYGGTSMVMTLLMIGILLNISRFRHVTPLVPSAAGLHSGGEGSDAATCFSS